MSITRRCDYACRIIRAAYRSEGAYISIAEVAEREQIPYSFARSIQHELVKEGFLVTNRGVRGGLTLACDPAKTTLLDVLDSLCGGVSVADCATCEDYPCIHRSCCEYNSVWRGADALLRSYYQRIALKDLFEMGGDHPVVKEALSLGGAEADG